MAIIDNPIASTGGKLKSLKIKIATSGSQNATSSQTKKMMAAILPDNSDYRRNQGRSL